MKYLIIIAFLFTALQAKAQDAALVANGAKVWANTCTRCHSARSPQEYGDRQWKTVIKHMRARANLTKQEAAEVEAYLQMVNGLASAQGQDLAPMAAHGPVHAVDRVKRLEVERPLPQPRQIPE